MTLKLIEMGPADIPEAITLWQNCEGIGLSDADEYDALKRFLEKNRSLSFVAREDGNLVGTCLCGTDLRRGYIYHLAIDARFRQAGIGKALVDKVFAALKELDIHKCHIMVYGNNELGLKFWKRTGWILRPEIELMSYDLIPCTNDCPC